MILDYIGPRIKQARKLKGYSQAKLAKAAKVDTSSILRIENNKRNLSVNILCSICSALDIDPVILFKKEGSI